MPIPHPPGRLTAPPVTVGLAPAPGSAPDHADRPAVTGKVAAKRRYRDDHGRTWAEAHLISVLGHALFFGFVIGLVLFLTLAIQLIAPT